MASAVSSSSTRIISRRAQSLLKIHATKTGKSLPSSQAKTTAKSSAQEEQTSWPKSVRYTFYTVCAAAVPFSIGTAISLSPRLRDWILGDAPPPTDDDGDNTNSSGFSGRKLIEFIRNYWGTEDYVPPIDRPAVEYLSPGYRKLWQEDNYSSFLHMLGMDNTQQQMQNSDEEKTPLSLVHEPPARIRHDQDLLDRFLSPVTNPEGVKTRLTLLPCTDDNDVENAGYDTECTLPANVSVDTLRQICQGSDAQYTRKVLADSWPDFRLVSSNERLRTGSWRKDCRWTISFTDPESDDVDDNNDVAFGDKQTLHPTMGESESHVEGNSDSLRKNTSIHSSWSYFAELDNGAVSSSKPTSPLGASMGGSGSVSTSSKQPSISSYDDLRIEQLQHQIATLKQELNDPSSFRDRDDMYAELKQAKRELRSLKPWWRVI